MTDLAFRTASLSFLFIFVSYKSSFSYSSILQASITAPRCFAVDLDPATKAATFCSSTTFQSINSSMSG